MKVVAYLRVSTAEQVERYGLPAQEQAIREWARAGRHQIVAWHSDQGVSGSNGLDTREGLSEALAAVTAGRAEALVVAHYDRLARDLLLQETVIVRLEQAGARVVSVAEPDLDSDDHTRILVRQILGAIAQYERAVIRGRMAAGKAAKARAGGYVGGQPAYGTQARDRALVSRDDEAEIVALVTRLRRRGASYREICSALTAAGHRPRRGEVWQPAVVRRIALRAA
jgi:DNA invertase Pin-like site-specific DNA recombinase